MAKAEPVGVTDVEFIVKRPSLASSKDLKLKLPRDATLESVKGALYELYDDHPHPSIITVISAGKVLRDSNEQLKDIFRLAGDSNLLPALHVVVRPDAPSTSGPIPATAAAASRFAFPPAPPAQPRVEPALTDPQPAAVPVTSAGNLGRHTAPVGAAADVDVGSRLPTSIAASAALAEGSQVSGSANERISVGGPMSSTAIDKGKTPASSALLHRSQPQPASLAVSPTIPTDQGPSSSLPQPELPPQLVNNPAMAAAFSAAFAALTSPTAIHNLGVPQWGSLQAQHPAQGQGTPQQALLDALLSGQPVAQQHPFPHLQPLFPQPISYMPVLGLVQPPPAENGQQQQPHYAPVLAPVVPMMMPYGMMPYSAGPVPFTAPQPPQPIPQGQRHPQPHFNMQNILQGMPGIGVWQPGGAAAERAAARAARGGRERRARPVRVRMVQINLRAILQLAVMGIILYQHCPPGRFLLFATIGLALYVTGPAPLRRAWQRLLAMLPPMHGPGQQNHGEGGAAAAAQPAAGAPAAAAAGGQQGAGPVGRPRGFVQEVQALFVGFFTSLLPGFNMNPEDAAAFAAAQQVANQNEAMAAARDNREHRD